MQPATNHSSYIIDKLSAAMQEALQFNNPSLSLLTSYVVSSACEAQLGAFEFLASLTVPLYLHLHGSKIVYVYTC